MKILCWIFGHEALGRFVDRKPSDPHDFGDIWDATESRYRFVPSKKCERCGVALKKPKKKSKQRTW